MKLFWQNHSGRTAHRLYRLAGQRHLWPSASLKWSEPPCLPGILFRILPEIFAGMIPGAVTFKREILPAGSHEFPILPTGREPGRLFRSRTPF